ncbi:conserved hypothetical protein [Trichinella spiralis]|uniref:hypothetical protein n=1 Tax=Trichinella spiralis TaxID=6334 RepID=UPI0001EFDA21|nr:conserved hypothetical protein [Trichinella spiralis]
MAEFSNTPFISGRNAFCRTFNSNLAARRRVIILLNSRYMADAIVIGRQFDMSVVPSLLGKKMVLLAFTDAGRSPAFSQRLKRLAMSAIPSGPTAVGREAFNSNSTSSAKIGCATPIDLSPLITE